MAFGRACLGGETLLQPAFGAAFTVGRFTQEASGVCNETRHPDGEVELVILGGLLGSQSREDSEMTHHDPSMESEGA